MGAGAGDGRDSSQGVRPGALTDLLRQVAAAPGPSEAEPPPLLPGATVGRFEILREVGRGGFGVVYQARDRELGRQVALKVVRPGAAVEEEGRVVREAEAIARLSHPNLITLHDVGRSDRGPYLVFEFLHGKTLQERLDEGPLPVQEAVHIAVEVARGLAHAHAEGVVHRDLKPSNVFVTNRDQVKILDFGMAHAFGRRRLSGGTPAYMAPEQWEDDPEDERTDVFALGVMLYRMLSGEYPFLEGDGERRWSAGPTAAPRLEVAGAPGLADLVDRMLEKAPKGRPRDGAAVLAALTPIEEALRARRADEAAPVHATRRQATLGDLLAELKRRRVFRVMVGYGIFAFAVLQVSEPIMHGAELPDWVLKAVLVALALGFPVAVVLSWVFDLTARGVTRTPSAAGPGAPSFKRSRTLLPLAVAAGVLAVSMAGSGAWLAWRRAADRRLDPGAAGPPPSVAVLSFADLSEKHDQEYLADGVAEEVLNGLAQVEGLRVVGRSTSFSYKGKGKKVEEIGRELGVGSVLEGSVRRSGDKVRITAQLVRARDASTLWSRSFDRSLSDVFAVQDEIGRAVVEALAVRLVPGRTLARSGGSSDPEALQPYLRGRDQLRRGGAEVRGAWRSFEQAVKVDPHFALGWVGVVDAIVTIEATAVELPGDPVARRRRAHEAADLAVGLAPGLADAYRARADVRQWLEADWRGQREDVERARALAPGDSAAALSGGFSLLVDGRTDEAVAEFERVTRIDPLLERGWVSGWLGLAAAAYSRGDHVKARQAADRMAELFPGYRAFALVVIAMDRVVAGEAREALATAGEFRAAGPPGRAWALLVEALAGHDLGRPADAARAREELARDFGAVGPYQVALAYAWAGDADAAFAWLERARTFPDTAMFWLKTDPLLQKIRSDPRWGALLRKADLPPDGPAPAGAPPAAATPSIAVLPFADMSEKHDQEYFADGVAEEILNRLAHVERLKVIGRTSSFSFKGKQDDLKAIGEKLGVANVLEGSLRKDMDGIRITAKLIRVVDGSQLWSESYDRKLSAIFKVQDEIAKAVVEALKVKLLPADLPRSDSTNPEAYRLYLLGRQFQVSGTPDGIEKSVRTLEQVVRLDPSYIPARVWLAVARVDRTNIGPADPTRQAEPEFDYRRVGAEGLKEAEKVVSLAPSAADGYWLRGLLRNAISFEWEASIDDYRRALSIAPGDAKILLNYARALMTLGRLPEALALARDAVASDPLSVEAARALGVIQAASGRAGEAAATFRRGLQVAPENAYLLRELGFACVLDGKGEEALQAAERNPSDWMRSMVKSLAYHQLGREKESRAGLDQLKAFERGGWIKPTYQIAQVHAWRGERELAFQWLDKALADHDGGITYIKFDPLISSLRSDPRYAALLRKLNLPVD